MKQDRYGTIQENLEKYQMQHRQKRCIIKKEGCEK